MNTQSDPIGLQGGINTYTYALGNPTLQADPLGIGWEMPSSRLAPGPNRITSAALATIVDPTDSIQRVASGDIAIPLVADLNRDTKQRLSDSDSGSGSCPAPWKEQRKACYQSCRILYWACLKSTASQTMWVACGAGLTACIATCNMMNGP